MIRTDLSDYTCIVPATLDEALTQRAEIGSLIPIAGGTEVMVWLNDGRGPGAAYQSLHRLAPLLRYVRENEDGGVTVGALATYTDLRQCAVIRDRYPLLIESARQTGALQIQNRGTLAGNIANGSPAADSAPPLLVYDARVHLASLRGQRVVPFSEFQTGYRRNVMERDELIVAISLPPSAFVGGRIHYRKVGPREAQAISKVVFAGGRSADGRTVRLAWGSLGATTLRTRGTEDLLASGADFPTLAAQLQREIAPIDDIRSTGVYRRQVAARILREFMGR